MNTEELQAVVDAWRVRDTAEWVQNSRSTPKWENPYGKQIHALNVKYGQDKKEALATLKEEYDKEYARLQTMSKIHEKTKPADRRGRPKRGDYDDAVKLAAAQAEADGVKRTVIRTTLAAQDTETLDRVLEEGRQLLKAQETSNEEW